ncbi:HTH-type transcriptional regulator CfxR [Saliniradius amylolyticus]|uniref:HTH-type transcriptional regulator CfxR n=1 Tax=Saliniradius amylolyticus TaxID=2183582 RepID=A0A2S2E3P6_9ALTE|nr:LysR family transcriptional regulator [Saliniradius amylolyticus]AWL12264.1 HTH-type transcriptional regulator CfxR [Saliniradius amylolyticus]
MSAISHRQLQVFVQLAQSGSFAEAAERLHLSQPALSIALGKFEQHIGGRLFSRTKRSVSLTPEGQAFLPVARRLLHDWEEAFSDLHNLFAMQRGKLTIAAMPSFANSLLPGVLSAFHRRWPQINLTVQDVVMERVIESVQKGRAELGVSFESERAEGMEFTPLFDDEFLMIMPRAHSLCAKDRLGWEVLAEHHYIAMNRGSALRSWCDRALANVGVQSSPVAEASQLSTVGELVSAGLGVAVVPALCKREMTRRGLECRPMEKGSGVRRVGVFRRSRASISIPAQACMELLSAYDWQAQLTTSS